MRKLSLSEFQRLAEARGGRCLSTEYINNNTHLEWECSEGHRWKATPKKIKTGQWCPHCSGHIKLTIEDVQRLAEARGGRCLSTEYVNNNTHLEWECSEGHKWKAAPSKVKNDKTWCPKCSGNEKLFIEDMYRLAKDRNGQCLSKEYINNSSQLEWKCKEGHIWKASGYSVKNLGSWCPYCSNKGNIREEICRYIFEKIFSVSFKRYKPSWLLNDRGNRMELDGFNEKIKVAFEHHGEQHYKLGFFINSQGELNQRKKDDKKKRQLCKSQGVTLFEIPFDQNLDELPKFIKNKIFNERKELVVANFTPSLNYQEIYFAQSKIKELQNFAKKKGGELLSNLYLGTDTHLNWRCSKGHKWSATPSKIVNLKTWCPFCAGQRLTINDCKKVAKERGGECLSNHYVNHSKYLKWKCKKGHIWEAPFNNVKNSKTWCPECGGSKKLEIRELQKIAEDRGGKCLSKEYINNKTFLEWECSQGNKWHANPNNIKNTSTWCPYCAGKKINIEDMKSLANKRGGKCLSNEYINQYVKLEWECSKFHRWFAKPKYIKSGTWCPKCANQVRSKINNS